jgi:multidrug efflux system membrane fusion protein
VNIQRAVLVVCILVGCKKATPPVAQATAVKVATVERATGGAGTRYSAQIAPATRVDLAFKVGGYVDSVAKVPGVDGAPRILQEGDAVRAGMELAAIRKTDFVQHSGEAQAAYAQAKAALDQAQMDFDRVTKLTEHNAIAGAELDSARTRRDSAAAVLTGARVRVDEAQTALADTVLRSPLAGVVVKRSIEVGALAAPGAIAFSVADVGSVKAAFGVPDTVLSRIHLGAPQRVTTDAYATVQFDGRISLIAPAADPNSRVFQVEVTIPNADGRLKPGMVASLALEGATDPTATAAPLVPLAAIVRSPHAGKFAVFVVEDKPPARPVARTRDVELGEYLGQVIPIRSGLTGGEQIVVQGAGLLSDGEPIEVIR